LKQDVDEKLSLLEGKRALDIERYFQFYMESFVIFTGETSSAVKGILGSELKPSSVPKQE